MFTVGDHVKFIAAVFHGDVVEYGRIYNVIPRPNNTPVYNFLPYENDALPFRAYEEELELVAHANIGLELFRICPNHCASGCQVCFMSPRSNRDAAFRTQSLIVEDIKAGKQLT